MQSKPFSRGLRNYRLQTIIKYLKIKMHFQLRSWFAYFCLWMANNSGVAFSCLFSIGLFRENIKNLSSNYT